MLQDMLVAAACLAASIGPWFYVAIHRDREVVQDPSDDVLEHAEGRSIWLTLVLMLIATIMVYVVVCSRYNALHTVVAYLSCWSVSGIVLISTWLFFGQRRKVAPGLVANFFMSGGFLGVSFALVLNRASITAWENLLHCTIASREAGGACEFAKAAIFLLAPGLIEETFKALWLFLRLRRSAAELPAYCCWCLPGDRSPDDLGCGGCWHKLAPTPYHVFLASLACGAGFGCFENLVYVFFKNGALVISAPTSGKPALWVSPLNAAVDRIVPTTMHMVWTGIIGLGLARRWFLPDNQGPRLVTVVLPSMVLHSFYDFAMDHHWILSPLGENWRERPFVVIAVMLLMEIAFLGSCYRIFCLTDGCRSDLLDVRRQVLPPVRRPLGPPVIRQVSGGAVVLELRDLQAT